MWKNFNDFLSNIEIVTVCGVYLITFGRFNKKKKKNRKFIEFYVPHESQTEVFFVVVKIVFE